MNIIQKAFLGHPEMFHPSWGACCWEFLTTFIFYSWSHNWKDSPCKQWVHDLLSYPSYILLAGRGTTKTTIEIGIMIWLSIKFLDYSHSIGLASYSKDYSEGIIRVIRQHLTNNEKLKKYFGNLIYFSRPPRADMIWIGNRDLNLKEATFNAVSVGSTKTGKHFQWGFKDDILEHKTIRTKLLRDRIDVWERTVWKGIMSKGYGDYFLGTRYHPDDIYGRRLGFPSEQIIKEFEEKNNYIALVPSNIESWSIEKNGKSQFPYLYSDKDIAKLKKEMGNSIFQAQMNQNPSFLQGKRVKYEYLNLIFENDFPPDLQYCISIDPAFSEKETASYTSIYLIAFKEGCFYCIDGVSDRFLTTDKMLDPIIFFLQKYNVSLVLIESVQAQIVLVNEFRKVLQVPVLGKPRSLDMLNLWYLVSHYFEANQIYINQKLGMLIDMLLAFPEGEHNDAPSALFQGMIHLANIPQIKDKSQSSYSQLLPKRKGLWHYKKG